MSCFPHLPCQNPARNQITMQKKKRKQQKKKKSENKEHGMTWQ
jgi:hypothetical protein